MFVGCLTELFVIERKNKALFFGRKNVDVIKIFTCIRDGYFTGFCSMVKTLFLCVISNVFLSNKFEEQNSHIVFDMVSHIFVYWNW